MSNPSAPIVDGTPLQRGDRVVLQTRNARTGAPWTRTGTVASLARTGEASARVNWDDGQSPKSTWVGAYVTREA